MKKVKKVYVVGAGVSGMSSAVQIAEHYPRSDAEVIVVAEKMTPFTTSDLVAGLWGPYLSGDTPEDKIVEWSKVSHDFFHHLWINGHADEAGIVMIPCYRMTTTEEPIGNPSWKHVVFGFRELSDVEVGKLSKEHGRNYTSGCHFVTFCCQPIKFLPFITKRFLKAGGKFESRKIQSFDDIRDADLIINCTGMGSRELGDEKVHPIRGQITRVRALWINNVIVDESDDGNYIIPNAETVVLGGTHQVNDFNLNFSLPDDDFIHNGCRRFNPGLEHAERIQDIVGLRPGREEIRLEIENRGKGKTTIIHNAGHGGCGITLCWGCGADVLQKAIEVLKVKSKL